MQSYSPLSSTAFELGHLPSKVGFTPGELVVPKTGYRVVCEVISVHPTEGLIRIRALDWPRGWTCFCRGEDFCGTAARQD